MDLPIDEKKQEALESNGTPDIETGEVLLDKNGFRLFPQPVQGDAMDPLNWSQLQKHSILSIVMALYVLLSVLLHPPIPQITFPNYKSHFASYFQFTYLTNTTVPSFPSLQTTYNASLNQINWTVAIPALGLSLGPLIWSSPADIIGRRPILLLGTTIALAATIAAALAPTYSDYMAARFFQGFGVSPAATVGLAVINDMYFEHERGQKVGLWVLALDLGLLFGPLIGGFVNLAGAAWIQWVTAIFLGVILVAEVVVLPETLYPRNLMLSRQGITSPSGEKTPQQASTDVRRTEGLSYVNVTPLPGVRHPKVWDTIVRFGKMFKYVVVPIAVCTYSFGWYWWILSVITMIPVAYESYPPQIQGLFFIGLIIGTLISEIFCSGHLSDWIVAKLALKHGGDRSPEDRIWLLYPAALLTAIGLIVWGVSIDCSWRWMVGQVAFALLGAGVQMGNTAVCAYVVDSYPLQSMSVVVFYCILLNFSAFVDPFLIAFWIDTAGFTWTFAGHAIITGFFCVPTFVLLQNSGGRIRAKTGVPNWLNPEFDQSGTGV